MSIVTLQLGQCGNQLGYALFDKLATELEDPLEMDIFFRGPSHTARAVLIDMEPKVVMQCQDRAAASGRWQYDRTNSVCQQSGSGNNWAHGYTVHGAASAEAILDVLQREVEHCDYFKGFHAIQSLAGGTGSGLGSFVADLLHDQFPTAHRLHTVIWPYEAGEIIVQNYNTLLTMACLSESSDGILLLQNDMADRACQKLLTIPKPSLDQMNHVLANHIASVLLPAAAVDARSACLLPTILRELCAHPGYKLLDIKLVPQLSTRSREFSTHQWSGILKHLHQMQIANCSLDEGVNWDISLETSPRREVNQSVGNLVFLRGPESATVAATVLESFGDPRMYAPWVHPSSHLFSSRQPFSRYDKAAALVSYASPS
ncbi:hypothetical protein, variant [Saprolegnia diclina VS20]|uniref:Tubulin delta chain n=1 Tax=Saprolegnia diclina (strain VS20) TaxID=1156394 RepID=T0RNL4_SAPDV|nr:hypothetical protein, variant [Saprolegnia diclina VS20]EQC31617.1 hypothetical protein, variant [Saprolegnia diclina VS20]|eukprot:XP_008615016.1 hypothetical protein, variant [Saprolegnia diclina VS20]